MSKDFIQLPRGTKDILPDDQKYWFYVFDIVKEKMQSFGARRIETPIIEFADIYTRALGKGTDIVEKEMYEVKRASSAITDTLDEKEARVMVLRPEYTAGIIRAYLQNGMNTWPKPVELWYWGPNFRYDRPQAGRYRIFNQFGIEIIGDDNPLTDSAVIFLSWQIIKKLDLEKHCTLDINSMGCNLCRVKMKKKLAEYFQNFLSELCPDCNRRFIENPLRIFDCKEPKCQKIAGGAPQIIDLLCPVCKNHFKQVLENLETLQIPYSLNPRLVRGLDYYTRTVFEIYPLADQGRQRTLIGGGRYDSLVKAYGGEDTPAIGWSGGIERIIEEIKENNIEIPGKLSTEICIVQVGDKARRIALPMAAKLENEGFKVTFILGKESLKGQLRSASKYGAKICLIIGQREVIDKSVIVRDMQESSQETIDQKKLVDFLKRKLNKL